jgi:hypothetical protein
MQAETVHGRYCELTWCQFEVVFSLGSHPVAVAAPVVPCHVDPTVVDVG